MMTGSSYTRLWVVAVVAFALALGVSSVAFAARAEIGDLIARPDRYLNQKVTVTGVVTEWAPGTSFYKWSYVLQDETDNRITVRSNSRVPPELNAVRTVTALVSRPPDDAKGAMLLEQANLLPYVYIGIGVLAILAIALIYQLVRKPELPPLQVQEAEAVPETRTDLGGLVVGYCRCGEALRQGWANCPKCGAPAQAPAQPQPAPAVRQQPARETRVLPPMLGELLMQTGTRDRIPLDKVVMTIGRDAANDIVFDDDTTSSHHARIRFENNQFILRDLDSTNKTYVNGEVVQERALKDGDELAFGPFVKAIFKQARLAPQGRGS